MRNQKIILLFLNPKHVEGPKLVFKWKDKKKYAILHEMFVNLDPCLIYLCRVDPEGGGVGGQGSRPPMDNHKAIGFLSSTGPDPLENCKTSKPEFAVGL